jgi:outer membrane protein
VLRIRLILIATCALVVWLLFLLPKAVVENDKDLEPSAKTADTHQQISNDLQSSINRLRANLSESKTDGKNPIFADSLAEFYLKAGRYDSAAAFFEIAATFFGTEQSILKAADAYYQAFSFSMDGSKSTAMAEKARSLYETLLKNQKDQPDLKVKLAMTYMSSSAPMQGIALLREVLEQYPDHEEGLLRMGMLSIRSGQFAKAIDWLKRLQKAHPENVEGQMLLGAAFAGAGEKEKALEQFERTRKMTNDPAVQQQLDAYVKDLK